MTKGGTDDVPSKLYAACSFSYLAAMMSSNQALQYVPYPTQVHKRNLIIFTSLINEMLVLILHQFLIGVGELNLKFKRDTVH